MPFPNVDLKANVPLDEALEITGSGIYTYVMIIMMGLVDFSAFSGIQLMSMVIPAASCELQLTTYEKGVLNSMVYGGMLFSSHMWGFLADMYGRRYVMLLCTFGSIFTSILCSLAPNSAFLMVAVFIFGLLLAGIFTPIFVYVSECTPPSLRANALIITCAVSSLTIIYLPGMAWIVIPLEMNFWLLGLRFTSWRLFVAMMTLPFLLAHLLLRYALPESPKYLLGKGNQEKTLAILANIYAKNNRSPPSSFPVMSVSLDKSDEMPEEEEDNSKPLIKFFKTVFTQTRMLFAKPFLKYTALSCMINVSVIGVFNTIQLWFPEVVNRLVNYAGDVTGSVRLCDVMAGGGFDEGDTCYIQDSVYIINMVFGGLQFVSYVLFSIIAPRVSKKRLAVSLAVLTTLSCGSVALANKAVLIMVSLGTAIVLLVVLFPLYISIVVDFFPTSLRSNATSIVMLCGRVSSVLGCQAIGALFEGYCELAYPILTTILLSMTVLFILLPTTRKV